MISLVRTIPHLPSRRYSPTQEEAIAALRACETLADLINCFCGFNKREWTEAEEVKVVRIYNERLTFFADLLKPIEITVASDGPVLAPAEAMRAALPPQGSVSRDTGEPAGLTACL